MGPGIPSPISCLPRLWGCGPSPPPPRRSSHQSPSNPPYQLCLSLGAPAHMSCCRPLRGPEPGGLPLQMPYCVRNQPQACRAHVLVSLAAAWASPPPSCNRPFCVGHCPWLGLSHGASKWEMCEQSPGLGWRLRCGERMGRGGGRGGEDTGWEPRSGSHAHDGRLWKGEETAGLPAVSSPPLRLIPTAQWPQEIESWAGNRAGNRRRQQSRFPAWASDTPPAATSEATRETAEPMPESTSCSAAPPPCPVPGGSRSCHPVGEWSMGAGHPFPDHGPHSSHPRAFALP